MAGYTLNASDINTRAGGLTVSLWQALEEVRRFKLWLDDSTHNDAAIGPTGIGVTTADLTIIRAAFNDLAGTSGLYGVAHGTVTPAGINNYFFNAKNLSGINYAA